jgi:hypothetical protein
MLSVAALGPRASVWPTRATGLCSVRMLPDKGEGCRWTPTLRFSPKVEAQCSAASGSMVTTRRCCLCLLYHRASVWPIPSMGRLLHLPMGVIRYRSAPTLLFIFFAVSDFLYSHTQPFPSFVISLVRFHFLGTGLSGGQRGACNVPPSLGQRTRTGHNVRRHCLYRLNASIIEQIILSLGPDPLKVDHCSIMAAFGIQGMRYEGSFNCCLGPSRNPGRIGL